MSNVITVVGLGKKLGKKQVLKDITFDVKKSERLMVFGPSGCGKSTLLRCLNRMIEVDSGTIEVEGKDILQMDPTQLRRKVGMVFQRPAIFDGTVSENISVGLKLHGMDEKKKVHRALNEVGLPMNFLRKQAKDLSGGEMQRVAIARALVMEPSILLLDEPTSALDERAAKKVERTLQHLAKSHGMTMIWVTHNKRQARTQGDRVLIMGKGVIKNIGAPAVVMNGRKRGEA